MNSAAEGRLGDVARLGCARKVAVFGERKKVLDPVQLHGRCRSGITSANFGIGGFLHPESIQSQGRWIAAGAAADQKRRAKMALAEKTKDLGQSAAHVLAALRAFG